MAAERSIARSGVRLPAATLVTGCDAPDPGAGARTAPAALTGDATGCCGGMIVAAGDTIPGARP